MSCPLIRATDIRVAYPEQGLLFSSPARRVVAVDGVSLAIDAGETLALVGESGCGKTSLGRALLRLTDRRALVSGTVELEGVDITRLSEAALRSLRARMQIVLQDSAAALDPRLRVLEAVAEPLAIHRLGTRRERLARAEALLARVGLSADVGGRFAHQLSGGERQRVNLARALACRPKLVVADEPLAGLDRSVQAQIANLFMQMQEEDGLAYLFISHDLGMVEHLADRVAVMFRGRIVEQGPARTLVQLPQHPYTRELLAARSLAPQGSPSAGPEGLSLDQPAAGCAYRLRCPLAVARCATDVPPLEAAGEEGQSAACFRVGACEPSAWAGLVTSPSAGQKSSG